MNEENEVLISIIVPVYNTKEYLPKCLNSIISQTFKNIEIICIDDGSTDGSLQILEEYQKKDNRIKIITQENKGVAAVRNTGLDVAKGKYIGFVDSDDYICSNMYEELYNDITKYNTDIAICNFYTELDNVFYKNATCSSKLIDNWKTYNYELLIHNFIGNYICFRLYKKELFDNIRFPVGKVFEDIYISSDLLDRINSAYYDEKPLYYYYSRNNSITHNMKIDSIIDAVDAYYVRYCKIKEKYKELYDVNVFTMIRWLCYMKEDMNDDELFYNTFDEILKDVTNEAKNVNFDQFCEEAYSYDVDKLVEDYNKRINDNK